MAKEDILVALLNHPQVKKRLDLGVLLGLSGHAQIDCAIGVVEKALNENPKHETLRKGYEALQREYPPHFGKGCYPTNIEVQQS